MNFRFSAILLTGVLLLTACQSKTDVTYNDPDVELAATSVLDAEPVFLEASFMSDQQSFSYELRYDGALLQVVDGQFEGASLVGPSFQVSGGTQIVVKSQPAAELADAVASAGAAIEVNGNSVYRSVEQDKVCTLERAIVPVGEESLVLTLRICDNQDYVAGEEALQSLLDQLKIQLQ